MSRAPLTVAELDALAAAGLLSEGASTELVAGVLLASASPSAAVLRAVADLAAALGAAAPDHRVEVRAALVAGPRDLLRPEVSLVRPAWRPASEAWPRLAGGRRGAQPAARWAAAGVALAVFVGEDEAPLRWRAHRCASAGVREVWTIAVGERRASRWRAPADGRYTRRDALPLGEPVAPDALPERPVVAWR
ncbi:MAG: hypothetical protein ABR510_03955 [Trueperaceae bacterium]